MHVLCAPLIIFALLNIQFCSNLQTKNVSNFSSPNHTVPSPFDEAGFTPESSPELTKRSWFGSLMGTERDETHVLLVRDKPLSAVKADLIHAFLSVSETIYLHDCYAAALIS